MKKTITRQFIHKWRWVLHVMLLLMLCQTPVVMAEEMAQGEPTSRNRINAIDVINYRNKQMMIKVTLDHPLDSAPEGISLNNPDRIFFDFADTTNALGKNRQEVGDGDLHSIQIAQTDNRTRMVINLSKPMTYESRISGNHLHILLTGVGAAEVASTFSPSPRTIDIQEKKLLSVQDIDFKRGQNGEGRVEVDLSAPGAGIDIRQQGNRIIVEFIKTYLPPNLERRLDVVDFATPVQIIETMAKGDSVQMIIEPKGRWEHTSYQAGTKFVLDVKTVVESEDVPVHKKLVTGGYTGEKLSLNFQNVEVRSVLQVLADFTNLNIIASDSVKGSLTLRLQDVPWDHALDIVLQSQELDKRRVGNVIFVAPREELVARERLDLESRQQISELEPLHTETFRLNYRTASSIAIKGVLSQRGTVEIDDISNTLTVTDVPVRLSEVAKFIANLDTPVRQVMIEARIVEAVETFSRSLGARFGVKDASNLGGSRRLGVSGGLEDSSGLATGGTPSGVNPLNVNLPAATLAGVAGGPATLGLSLFKINSNTLINLELSALESDNKGKVIASPRLVTANRVEATIEQGTEIPFQIVSQLGRPQIQFKKAVLALRVTPQITPDDNIIMKLQVNQDTRGAPTPAGPAIDTKQITTEVLVENGGTVVIGGIFERVERQTTNRLPFLGEMPFLGNLFRNNLKEDNKRELLIFVTPRILNENVSMNQR